MNTQKHGNFYMCRLLIMPVFQPLIDMTLLYSQFISALLSDMPDNKATVTSLWQSRNVCLPFPSAPQRLPALDHQNYIDFLRRLRVPCMPRGLPIAAKHAHLPSENANRPVFRSEAQNYLSCRKIVFCVYKSVWTNRSDGTIKNAVKSTSFCISR